MRAQVLRFYMSLLNIILSRMPSALLWMLDGFVNIYIAVSEKILLARSQDDALKTIDQEVIAQILSGEKSVFDERFGPSVEVVQVLLEEWRVDACMANYAGLLSGDSLLVVSKDVGQYAHEFMKCQPNLDITMLCESSEIAGMIAHVAGVETIAVDLFEPERLRALADHSFDHVVIFDLEETILHSEHGDEMARRKTMVAELSRIAAKSLSFRTRHFSRLGKRRVTLTRLSRRRVALHDNVADVLGDFYVHANADGVSYTVCKLINADPEISNVQ